VVQLDAHEGAEACVCELTDPIGLSQPPVSHHLKILSMQAS
jgi:ArsR family transcriptional regulator, arsenate/arsenite/antimonite-responsive transcriptional repressor